MCLQRVSDRCVPGTKTLYVRSSAGLMTRHVNSVKLGANAVFGRGWLRFRLTAPPGLHGAGACSPRHSAIRGRTGPGTVGRVVQRRASMGGHVCRGPIHRPSGARRSQRSAVAGVAPYVGRLHSHRLVTLCGVAGLSRCQSRPRPHRSRALRRLVEPARTRPAPAIPRRAGATRATGTAHASPMVNGAMSPPLSRPAPHVSTGPRALLNSRHPSTVAEVPDTIDGTSNSVTVEDQVEAAELGGIRVRCLTAWMTIVAAENRGLAEDLSRWSDQNQSAAADRGLPARLAHRVEPYTPLLLAMLGDAA